MRYDSLGWSPNFIIRIFGVRWSSGARFTKYLTTALRLSYDNVKVTIDLQRTSNLQNILQ